MTLEMDENDRKLEILLPTHIAYHLGLFRKLFLIDKNNYYICFISKQ